MVNGAPSVACAVDDKNILIVCNVPESLSPGQEFVTVSGGLGSLNWNKTEIQTKC